MTVPIAQTFYINEPVGGVEGIILTSVDIYFQQVSSNYSVELRICTTQNGQPTAYMLPEATITLNPSDTYSNGTPIIRASADATIPTRFTFNSPITLQTQTSYALVVIPVGGNPDYTVWTGAIGGSDVTTNTPIYQSATTYGTLYLSTNDIDFTAVNSEAMKYTIYTADFTTSNSVGTAVYNIANSEQILVSTMTGNFTPNERVYVSNNVFNQALLTISSNTGSFTSGENVYQSNGSANVASGYLVFANTTKLIIGVSRGAWVVSSSNTTFNVIGATSGANGVVSVVSQNAATYSNTTITLPTTSNGTSNIFYSNQTIFIATSSRSIAQPRLVVSTVNSTAITVDANVTFTDPNALVGKINGDNYSLYGYYSGTTGVYTTSIPINLYGSTSNSTVNFSNSYMQYLIGSSSGASATIRYINDSLYDAVVPNMAQNDTQSTNIDWSLKGITASNTYDSTAIPLKNFVATEFSDTERAIKSRSTEYLLYSGNSTTTITASITTSNNKISPYIDKISNSLTLTKNLLYNSNNISGYVITRSISGNNYSYFKTGMQVTQNNGVTNTATGTVLGVDPNYISICNVSGNFVSGNTIYQIGNSSVNALVTSSTEINEKYSANVFLGQSRYISKSVVLATGQDAEDLVVYIGAYRPAGSNLQVYGQLLNANDPDPLTSKIYSRLVEQPTSTALVSSSTNTNDFVELVYGLPQSQLVYSNSVACSNASANITINSPYTVAPFSNGQYIYLNNANTGGGNTSTFNVRQIVGVNLNSNSTVLTLNSPPSVVGNSTWYADIGIIPGLEHQSGAFDYMNNLGIVRYVSNTDIVYDSFLTFAIKIVPTSNNPVIVPRCTDMRALALQV